MYIPPLPTTTHPNSSQSPPHAFFLLNRNGVENFNGSLSAGDDLDVTPEFIIYRAESKDREQAKEHEGEGEGEEKVYGIWIFEQAQREEIGREMVR